VQQRHTLLKIFKISILSFFLLPATVSKLHAQLGASVSDVEKPKKFENRKLASEKPTDKKLNPVKKFGQNLISHYNYEFNAYNELNEVVLNAKEAFKDDYRKLLPFYNYSLDYTAEQKSELDSVIHKCNNGILLHDLRSDWVDNLYLLMGQSYFFQKNYDSAAITFQYINYAFQPRNKDEIGYDKKIGSNINTTGNVYTISTKEKSNIVNNTFGHTPSRNDAMLWYIRTLLEMGYYNQTWGLIETLKRDANLPVRLKASLEEMQALYFYRQEQWDSAAVHLEKALSNADAGQERSRWEFLIAQMYERTKKNDLADEWYEKAVRHTTDPVLEAYARINQIRLVTGDDEQERIRQNLEALAKMARRSKYEEYRHIIYYAAAQMEIQRNQPDAAIALLRKSISANLTDDALKNNAFLLMANLAYDRKLWGMAYANYDSLNLEDPAIENGQMLLQRKMVLGEVVKYLEMVRVEDSLQKVANMPEEERKQYIKALVKKLRKEKGLKDEAASLGGTADPANSVFDENKQVDIFQTNDSKGEWYFYNTSLKAQGYRQFRNKWGVRPPVDNWRRGAAVQNSVNIPTRTPEKSDEATDALTAKASPKDITTEGLLANLPLTPELLQASNDSLESSFYSLGKIFKDQLNDCDETIKNYELLLNRFPETKMQEEALFGLYYCYNKAGNTTKANFYKGFLSKNFSQGKYLKYINNPKQAKADETAFTVAATKKYEQVYNLFIEGKFDEALAQKKLADSTYGDNYWTPQLLYIESIYYIRQKQDSTAIATLDNLIRLYPQSNLGAKASNMLTVLSRRAEIENYLDTLQVTRMKEDSVYEVEDLFVRKEQEKITREEKPVVKATEPVKPIEKKVDSTVFKAPVTEKKASGYSFNAAEPQKVVLILDKVDVVYVNEARRALDRYNKEKYYNQPLEMEIFPYDDNVKMVLIGQFSDAGTALAYVEKTRAIAQAEIFPWLPKDKWKFLLLSPSNLEVLKEQKNLDKYLDFLKQNIPGKF
jgi:tetratricopeptide (TPR) repeat protein